MFTETIRLALQAVRRNALRSFLTVLGIVIGVGSVIAMVTIGNGTTAKVASDLAKLGSNLLFVAPGQFGPGLRHRPKVNVPDHPVRRNPGQAHALDRRKGQVAKRLPRDPPQFPAGPRRPQGLAQAAQGAGAEPAARQKRQPRGPPGQRQRRPVRQRRQQARCRPQQHVFQNVTWFDVHGTRPAGSFASISTRKPASRPR